MEGANGSAAGDEQIMASEEASNRLEISTDSGDSPGTAANIPPTPEQPSPISPYAESSAGVHPCGETFSTQPPPTKQSPRNQEVSLSSRGGVKAGSDSACDFRAAESARATSTNRPASPREEANSSGTQLSSGTTSAVPLTNRAVHSTPNALSGLAHGLLASARDQQVLMQSEQAPAAISEVPISPTDVGMVSCAVRFCSGGASGVNRTTGAGSAQPVTCLLSGDGRNTDITASSYHVQSSSTEEMAQGDVTPSTGAPRAVTTGEAIERSDASIALHADRENVEHDGEGLGHVALRTATANNSSSPPASKCTRQGAQSVPSGIETGAPPDATAANKRLPSSAESPHGLVAPGIIMSPGAPAAAVARSPPQTPASRNSTPTPSELSNGAIALVPGSQRGSVDESLPDDPGGRSTKPCSAGSEGPSADSLAPLSVHERSRAEQEQAGTPPWGERIEADSHGDTVDVALAAVSYANAVAEAEVGGVSISGTTAGLESGRADEQMPVISSHSGGSSMSDAAEPNATANDLTISLDPRQEREGEMTMSTSNAVSSATAQPASRASSNGNAASKVADTSCGSAAAPAQGTARADGSKGRRTVTKGKKRSRASDHHEDLMHAMCMICLEKLSESSEGGGAKLLGLLDSCSHRYCYTVSDVVMVTVAAC